MVSVTVGADPAGGFRLRVFVDGHCVHEGGGFASEAEARRAGDDLVDMLEQTGGKRPPEGVQ